MARTNRQFSWAEVLLFFSIVAFGYRNHTTIQKKCQYLIRYRAKVFTLPDHSLLRMILPLIVLGSSVRNSTIRGYL